MKGQATPHWRWIMGRKVSLCPSWKMKRDSGQGFMRLLLVQALLLVLPSLGLAQLSHAQIVNASLYGSVTDPSGAAIPDATITATNVATGVGIKSVTDAAGNYLFPSLPPATYNITVEKASFKTTMISGI